jgi:hypothetical protein
MKLEYLHDLTAKGKFKDVVSENLIRLWDFGPKESKLFQNLINDFAKDEQKEQLILDEQEFIEAINCKLTLKKDNENNGISRIGTNEFICKLDTRGYEHIVSLIEPFIKTDSGGYQWLDEKADVSDIDFLFSPGGTW